MNILPKPKVIHLNEHTICKHTDTIHYVKDEYIQKEGYKIEIQEDKVTIFYSDDNGLHYGLLTYENMVKEGNVHCGIIEDYPSFHYRGVHLDVARHFLCVNEVKRFIDLIGKLKFNVLHLHLSDEQGWRIQIDTYPLLTELGSKRPFSNFGRTYVDTPHDGFYTKEQIKDIVAYAKAMCIDIMPEIDVPGHCSTILIGYPQFSCRDEHVDVKTRGGVFDEILCAGNEDVYQFMYDIIDELCVLFPYEYIHIGADEAKKDHWRTCPKCQEKMKKENLQSVAQLQDYFVHKISTYIRGKGKKAVMFSDGLRDKNQCEHIDVQYWVGDKEETKKIMEKGNEVIVSTTGKYYFDLSYGQISLRNVYEYDPCASFAPYEDKVKGVEGMLWSEFLPDFEARMYRGFPRLLALCETGWNRNEKDDYESFKNRCRLFIKEQHIGAANEDLWDMSKMKRIKDVIKFYHNTMTKQDVKQFISTLKNERKEKEENEKIA